jgi:osmotically-inducible protein OsmY
VQLQRTNKGNLEGELKMASRYDERDYDRGVQYGQRRNSAYGGPGVERSRTRSRYDRDEGERYAIEDRWRGDYGGSQRNLSRPWREGEYSRNYSGSGIDWEGERDSYEDRWQSRYGSSGRGYDTGPQYGEAGNWQSQRYRYPTGFRTRETYGGHGAYEDYGPRFLRDEREYDYDRSRNGSIRDYRGWWDRASDEVASWFGDEEAARRRRLDQRREEYRGRGPKNYRRSDERIEEDVNDRLSEGYLDASDIEVSVASTEVTLTGNVNSRTDKRRAEVLAESVTGVTHVENRLRVKQYDSSAARSGTEASGTASSMGTTGSTTTTGTSSRRAASGS